MSRRHSSFYLVPPGEDRIEEIDENEDGRVVVCWHGSSMPLITKGTTMLNQEFNDVDPEKDFAKWRELGGRPYFLSILQQQQDGAESYGAEDQRNIACCLRCILHGDWDYSSSFSADCDNEGDYPLCRRRLVVDFLCTKEDFQGKGYAGQVLDLVMQFARTNRSNCYVIAVEDSCVYWMAKGFILEEESFVQERLNVFSDTHLLKLPSNRPEDAATFPAEAEGSESNGSDDEDSSDDDSEDDDDSQDSKSDGDDDLQRAILQSMNM